MTDRSRLEEIVRMHRPFCVRPEFSCPDCELHTIARRALDRAEKAESHERLVQIEYQKTLDRAERAEADYKSALASWGEVQAGYERVCKERDAARAEVKAGNEVAAYHREHCSHDAGFWHEESNNARAEADALRAEANTARDDAENSRALMRALQERWDALWKIAVELWTPRDPLEPGWSLEQEVEAEALRQSLAPKALSRPSRVECENCRKRGPPTVGSCYDCTAYPMSSDYCCHTAPLAGAEPCGCTDKLQDVRCPIHKPLSAKPASGSTTAEECEGISVEGPYDIGPDGEEIGFSVPRHCPACPSRKG